MARARWKRNRKLKCTCGGYHFPHRRGGGACLEGPRAEYYERLRQGESKSEAMLCLTVDQLERMFPEDGATTCLIRKKVKPQRQPKSSKR